jgi:hypothetical protein
MNRLRQLSAAVMLTFAFALSASAGDMSAGIASPQPQQQTGQTSTVVMTPGDMSAGVTQITVSLIQSLLALV